VLRWSILQSLYYNGVLVIIVCLVPDSLMGNDTQKAAVDVISTDKTSLIFHQLINPMYILRKQLLKPWSSRLWFFDSQHCSKSAHFHLSLLSVEYFLVIILCERSYCYLQLEEFILLLLGLL